MDRPFGSENDLSGPSALRRRANSVRRLDTPFVANGFDQPPLRSPSLRRHGSDPTLSPAASPAHNPGDENEPFLEGTEQSDRYWGVTLYRSLAALGVVYGDIGTSPLYVFSATFERQVNDLNQLPTESDIIGTLSTLIWSLFIIVCFKYLAFILQADYEGEGGVFCLLKHLPQEKMSKTTAAATAILTMWGAALVIGDGAITPAISVLSAVEGITLQYPSLETAVVPIAVSLLLVLFLVQRWGTESVGRLFGPIMFVWFVCIASTGLYNVIKFHYNVLRAFNPYYAVMWWAEGNYQGIEAWKALGGVVLCLTGAEALYADLGHFGRTPIYVSWFGIVFWSLLLQYCGQGAFLIALSEQADKQPYQLALRQVFWSANPEPMYYPMLVLASVATLIASQAVISACFSLLSQASSLEFAPRVNVIHTSEHQMGQVFIPEVNFLLAIICTIIVVTFKDSASIAGAYGVAVTSAFIIDSVMYAIVARVAWQWSWIRITPLLVIWLSVDLLFWTSNLTKVTQGGWFPLVLGFFVLSIMLTWTWGRSQESKHEEVRSTVTKLGASYDVPTAKKVKIITLKDLMQAVRNKDLTRSAGVGIFLTRNPQTLPRALSKMVARIGALPKSIILLTVKVEEDPFVLDEDRISVRMLDLANASKILHSLEVYSIVLHRGWAEPLSAIHVPELLKEVPKALDSTIGNLQFLSSIDTSDPDVEILLPNPDEPITFYLNLTRFKPHPRKNLFHKLLCTYFNILQSVSVNPVKYFKLPVSNCVEVGSVTYL